MRPAFIVCLSATVQLASAHSGQAQVLLVSNNSLNNVMEYNATTGAFISQIVPGTNSFPGAGGLVGPIGLAVGPDGNFYVGGNPGPTGQVFRYNGATGTFMGSIYLGTSVTVRGMAFGPDGLLYVADAGNQRIVQVNVSSGTSTGTFVSGPQLGNPESVAFGPDGNLYVSCTGNNSIEKYNGTTGAYLGGLTSPSVLGYGGPSGLAFSPGGDLFASVASQFSPGAVVRYNGTTGALDGLFASTLSLTRPYGLAFGPDGNLYVSDSANSEVDRFNGTTGAFIGTFVTSGPSTDPSWLVAPTYLAFAPTPVPEPSTLSLAIASIAIAAACRRRFGRSSSENG